MDPVAQIAVLVALAAVALGACAVAGRRTTRAARSRRAALDEELVRARAEVDQLSHRVDQLSQEMQTRRVAHEEREYVITSLGEAESVAVERPEQVLVRVDNVRRRHVGRLVEDRLVQALTRDPGSSPGRDGVVQLAVRGISLAHGLRRAFSPDVLDRAAAEAHVARRRSRRERKREIREARRLLRAVSTQRRSDQDVA